MKVVWETTDETSGMSVADANEDGSTQNRPPICFTSRLFLLRSFNETPFQCGPSIDIAFGVHNDDFFAYHCCFRSVSGIRFFVDPPAIDHLMQTHFPFMDS
jgi:hypothetical protein